MAQTANPGLFSAASASMSARRALMRAVYGGTETLRAARETYLPRYENESPTRYETRLAAATSLNKLREAVDAASAKPFKTMIKLINNTDADLDQWVRDIDLTGNHLHIFAHQHFNDSLLMGQGHILVDHPTTSNMPNLGAQLASGVRPFMKYIRDDDLRAAYSENVGGDIQVTHVRIFSTRVEREPGTFKEKVWNQIYVIEKEVGANAGVVQVWEQDAQAGGDSWDLISESPLTMPEVPFVTLYAGEKEGDFITRPIFLDLAHKQVEHYQSSADQRSILSAARFPMLAASGIEFDEEEISKFTVGPYKALFSPDPQGRYYYVEPAGRAIKSGADDLAAMEIQMDMMSLNPVVGTHRQYVPANERDIAETRVHSVVHDLALSEKDALERAIGFMGTWVNRDFSNVGVGLNSDFTNTKDKMIQMGVLLNAFTSKAISLETFLEQARRLDLVDDEFDVNAEVQRLAAANAALADEEDPNVDNTGPVAGSASDPVRASTTAPVDFPNGRTRPRSQI
jgi:hypothetical protein